MEPFKEPFKFLSPMSLQAAEVAQLERQWLLPAEDPSESQARRFRV